MLAIYEKHKKSFRYSQYAYNTKFDIIESPSQLPESFFFSSKTGYTLRSRFMLALIFYWACYMTILGTSFLMNSALPVDFAFTKQYSFATIVYVFITFIICNMNQHTEMKEILAVDKDIPEVAEQFQRFLHGEITLTVFTKFIKTNTLDESTDSLESEHDASAESIEAPSEASFTI